jgi:hypothetical protein
LQITSIPSRQRILCNQPPPCNCANINPRPFDLDQTVAPPSLDVLQTNARTLKPIFFTLVLPSPNATRRRTEQSRLACPCRPGLVVAPSLLQRSSDGRLCLGPCWTSDGGILPSPASRAVLPSPASRAALPSPASRRLMADQLKMVQRVASADGRPHR